MNAVDPVYLRRGVETAETIALRSRIADAGGKALRRSERTLSDDAGALLLLASQSAAAWSFKIADAEQLLEVIAALASVTLAANAFERAEAVNGAC